METCAGVTLVCVDPKQIVDFWPHVRGTLKSAIDHTGLSDFNDLETDVLYGDQLLWLAWSGSIEAVATTRLCEIGGRKICVLTACAGENRRRWLPLRHKIEEYAKAEGCACVRLFGRKGWERELPDYKVEHIVMEKAL